MRRLAGCFELHQTGKLCFSVFEWRLNAKRPVSFGLSLRLAAVGHNISCGTFLSRCGSFMACVWWKKVHVVDLWAESRA